MEIIGLAVLSLDGCLTRHAEHGVSFASDEDQAHFRATLAGCDSAIMGRATFDAARTAILRSLSPSLRRIVMTRSPAAFEPIARPGELEFTDADPRAIVDRLRGEGRNRVAVLGGGQVYGAFVRASLLTEWQITVEPRLFGTGTRLIPFDVDQRLRLVERRMLNDDTILLRYKVRSA